MTIQNKKNRLRTEINNLKQISLTTLLSGLVIISTLMTLTIMVISSYTSQKQSLINNVLALNYESAVQMSQTLDLLFQSMQQSLKYGASHLQDTDFTHKLKLNNTLSLIQNSSDYFNSVALTDETGLLLSMSPYSLVSVGKHIRSEDAKAAIKARASYISEAYITPYTKNRIIFLSEPIFDKEGKYKGILSGSILLQQNNILNLSFGNQLKRSDGSYFFIVDHKGTLLFHPNINLIGEDISQNKVVQKLIKDQTGKERYVNLSGVDSLAGYYKVPANNWGMVIVTPTQTVFDQLNRQIELLLLYTLGPFLILILIVLRVARKLTQPFVFLTNLINQVAAGQTQLPPVKPHWNREANMLNLKIFAFMEIFKNKTNQLVIDARTDVLTGLNNRRTFEEVIQQWIQDETPFAMIVLDIDHFKIINDTFGHSVGDEVLKKIAQLIQASVRPEDICSRFGGEEFVILLHDSNSMMAYLIAEYIRISVKESVLVTNHLVTISAGITEFPLHSLSATELFQLADNALYQAKQEGRNRTIIAQQASKS
ncbi:diguanylate cyclase (GGDEF)-like protein [Paenibacillus sp. JGP012]|uniref:sensor domain-containing diguanylate cyclase n=1 Tax=Paenibacillus sp. JGP012 TaxID=2735914 RepID=UPI00161C94AE|nr:diguanylate cyclase [Paenibacillus sp. JGP012]MBB6021559.1 diguanylate cyclase (GGDEF)-like protein [Paenibacillus sp. JGP012]